MRKLHAILTAVFLLTAVVFSANAQNDKSKRPSPPKTASGSVGDLNIIIDYGAPSVKGRTIFGSSGSLESYGKVWRTGANEATTFSVNKDVTINGEPLAAGKYALFTIPEANEWTVIFNKKVEQWGAYDYKSEDDALRVKVPAKKLDKLQEQMVFKVNNSGQVEFAWEHVGFDFMVKVK